MQVFKKRHEKTKNDLCTVFSIFPDWVPSSIRCYFAYQKTPYSLRTLAQFSECAASTVLRQIRGLEARKHNDILFAWGMDDIGAFFGAQLSLKYKGEAGMTVDILKDFSITKEQLEKEGKRILRRLCEPRALLAVSHNMENAVVMRLDEEGKAVRTAITTREIAKIFALKEWVCCVSEGRTLQYRITSVGRQAFKRMMAKIEHGNKTAHKHHAKKYTTQETPYGAQHREWSFRSLEDPEDGKFRKMYYNIADTPILMLARRKAQDGKPFLKANHVNAGERLREDFEVAQIGPHIGQNWDKFLTGADPTQHGGGSAFEGSMMARERFEAAIEAVGPGLRDILLRCCCHLQGVESAERSLGWSARSGKVVLRIALEQLSQHYNDAYRKAGKSM